MGREVVEYVLGYIGGGDLGWRLLSVFFIFNRVSSFFNVFED